jgi:mRNA interferase RelE/StbE
VAAYRVEVATHAQRDLQRLAPSIVGRIHPILSSLGREPRPAGSQKLVGLEAYRIRVGDHRVLYEIDDAARVIVVIRVRHRREVYRKLR